MACNSGSMGHRYRYVHAGRHSRHSRFLVEQVVTTWRRVDICTNMCGCLLGRPIRITEICHRKHFIIEAYFFIMLIVKSRFRGSLYAFEKFTTRRPFLVAWLPPQTSPLAAANVGTTTKNVFCYFSVPVLCRKENPP